MWSGTTAATRISRQRLFRIQLTTLGHAILEVHGVGCFGLFGVYVDFAAFGLGWAGAMRASRSDCGWMMCMKTVLSAGAVVVVREGEVWGQWFHGVERSGGDPVSGASMFRLASVSKQFTVAGVLTAVGQGRLGLDDDIRVWLLECPYEGVTVRHLMQHVSGIPDFYMDSADSRAGVPGDCRCRGGLA